MEVYILKTAKKLTAVLTALLLILNVFTVGLLPAVEALAAVVKTEYHYDDPRLELDFNNNWKFNLGDTAGASSKVFEDSSWTEVELPHDFSISQNFSYTGTDAESGNLPGGTGWYRKWFNLDSYYNGKRIILNFDGAYKDTYVYVNGTLLAENHYGYNSFSVDITDYVVFSKDVPNLVAVKVENTFPSSRWYPGSGIYRDVTISIVDPVHVSLYGTKVTMPNLASSNGADGTVRAEITLQNDSASAKTVSVVTSILDSSGNTVSSTARITASIGAGSVYTVHLTPKVESPALWDTENPNLYVLKTEILSSDGTVIDEYLTDIGFRWMSWDINNGFYLNGVATKLKGVCMHHDQGALGAVQVYDAIYRQMALLKDMGCNTIRTSHNSPSDILLDVCNELGILVMDEFFDGWDTAKNYNTNDFSVYFDTEIDSSNKILGKESGQMWYEFVITQTIKRDRNDPCVIIWDVGNEISEGGSVGDFGTIAANMRTIIDSLDSTRLICDGNNQRNISSGWSYEVEKQMTLIGGNYAPATWAGMFSQISTHTDAVTGTTGKPFIMTETTSALSSRNQYSNTKNNSVKTMTDALDGNDHITSYDTAKVSWGNTAADNWYYVITNDWFSGQYTWTGFDYIGEPTPKNHTSGQYSGSVTPNSSYFGIIDTAGFPKDTYYLYRSWWNEADTTLHLIPGTWKASVLDIDSSGYVDVGIYSNADRIALYLDGREIGYANSTTVTTSAGHTYKTWSETATDTSVCNTTEFYTQSGSNFYSQFHVKHSAGSVLSVKAFELRNGSYYEITDTVGTNSISDVTATKITATQWGDASKAFTADGDSYIYIEFEAQDENGNFDPSYNGTLNITVANPTGTCAAIIQGVDNGDQATTAKYQNSSVIKSDTEATIQMFNGKALAILRTNETRDTINVTATSDTGLPVNGVTPTSTAEEGAELTDEFEEIIEQTAGEYTPTLYDEYESIKLAVEALGTVTGEKDYVKYTANPDGATALNTELPDGWYVITGQDDQGGGYSRGAVTHVAHTSGGFVSDGNTGTPANGDNAWYFEKTTGGYYIYYTDSNGTKQYLTISNNEVYVSTAPYTLTVTADNNGNVNIGFGSTWLNYHGGQTNRVWYWSTPTNLTLYQVKTETVTETSLSEVTSSSDFNSLNGKYIITGRDTTGSATYGSMTHTAMTFNGKQGFSSANNSVITANEEHIWIFEKVSSGYYIYFLDSYGRKNYMTIDSSGITTSTSEKVVTVTASSTEGKAIIGTPANAYKLNYYGNSGSHFVGPYQNGSLITLYKVTESGEVRTSITKWTPEEQIALPTVDNGGYVIYNGGYILSDVKKTYTNGSTGTERVSETPSNDVITTDSAYEYYFTLASGTNQYHITNSDGEYMNIGTSNGTVTFSSTPQALTVHGRTDGTVVIYSGSQFLDNYSTENMFSSWTGTVSGASNNRIFTLYRNENSQGPSSGAKAGLVEALSEGITRAPGGYSLSTYQALIDAENAALAVYNDPDATADEIANAENTLRAAIEALEINIKKLPATLFKYGYDNTSGKNYNDGGTLMNTVAVDQMKEMIRADENLVNQIKEIIDYDGVSTSWGEGFADTALTEAINRYANIYTLYFTGHTVAGGSTKAEGFDKTSWNVWTKTDTQGTGENKDEGASVQGLASATLVDGTLKSHAAYTVPLEYRNIADYNSFGLDANISLTLTVSSGNTKTVELIPLTGISVHSPDLFVKELMLSDGSITTATTGDFAKFYWDTEIPFLISTDEYGINTYKYDSANEDFLLQTEFNDASNTAVMELTEVSDWSINKQDAGAGKGFFPFNYQNGVSSLTGENAIYHFGFNFTTDFYIPSGGTYLNGEDIVFNFSGDDDVYVYIDDVLVLDNGGLHGARSASINFTDCSVSYQYALDVTEGTVKSTTENDVYYVYGGENAGISADNLAALEKLNEVRNGGQVHTFTFFYLERGSTESNCKIFFNLSETSNDVKLNSQSLTVDYGHPLEYNITANNVFSDLALENGSTVTYLGIASVNENVENAVSFDEPEILIPFEDEYGVYDIPGLKYGTGAINKQGNISYSVNTMNFTESDYFFVCAEINNDPTYAKGTTYYQYEKTTFIPATTIYYEDNFTSVTYTDGKVADNYDADSLFGKWQRDGEIDLNFRQTADLSDSESLPYGFEQGYTSFKEFSGNASHFVDVSTKNNPSSRYSGGEGGKWPEASFTFTGTGFDLISVTDDTTGAFEVRITDEDGNTVHRNVVDTYYGYSYGRIYSDENGNPSLDESGTPMYRSENGKLTPSVRYYDENGALTADIHYLDISGEGYSDTPCYYDENGELTYTETDSPAYSYAYGFGWVTDTDSETLYQIPVIKVTDLTYGTYTVKIIPTFTTMFRHYLTSSDGTNYYRFYLDAVKIYDPAGVGDEITDTNITGAYKTDNEMYPDFIEIKDMLIGADSMAEDKDTQGIIFIDGIAASDNDIETYKKAGPNNELYLAQGQAVAFEIWATSVPTDIQLGAKLATGDPALTVSYNAKTTEKEITTATDLFYSFNQLLPTGGKLTWQQIQGSDGNTYYTTGTIVVQNTGDEGSILSLTNLKWSFSVYGAEGHFRIPAPIAHEAVMFMLRPRTVSAAYDSVNMLTADLTPEISSDAEITASENGSASASITVTTSEDVHSLLITDENGNTVDTASLDYIIRETDDGTVKEWTVTLTESENGIYTYFISGVYENGYTDPEKTATLTVTVDILGNEEENESGENSTGSFLEKLIGFFEKLRSFFEKLLAFFGITF